MIDLLARLLAPRVIRPRSPTADLYFLNACGDLVGPDGPVRQVGPTVLASSRATLVIRHMAGMRRLPERPRTVWLIDDAIEPALRDPDLPMAQRAKLWLYERPAETRMLASGAQVVVSSETLRARYAARARTHLLLPYWGIGPGDLAHQTGSGPVRLAYLGSAVHGGDLAFLVPVLRAVLNARPQAELHLAANHRPGPLAGHPRLIRFAQTGWPAYRAALPGWRFHIALYPLLPTETNRARSCSKLTEHAITGAASLVSEGWPEAARAAGALALPPDRAAWEAALLSLIDDPGRRLALAEAGQAQALERDRPEFQRSFWRHMLDL